MKTYNSSIRSVPCYDRPGHSNAILWCRIQSLHRHTLTSVNRIIYHRVLKLHASAKTLAPHREWCGSARISVAAWSICRCSQRGEPILTAASFRRGGCACRCGQFLSCRAPPHFVVAPLRRTKKAEAISLGFFCIPASLSTSAVEWAPPTNLLPTGDAKSSCGDRI